MTVGIATRVSLIVADIVVIIASWIKTHGLIRDVLRFDCGTSFVMLADGARTSHETTMILRSVFRREFVFHVSAYFVRRIP